jgi:hypothetical protein
MDPFLEDLQIEEFILEEDMNFDDNIPEMDDLCSDIPFGSYNDF